MAADDREVKNHYSKLMVSVKGYSCSGSTDDTEMTETFDYRHFGIENQIVELD